MGAGAEIEIGEESGGHRPCAGRGRRFVRRWVGSRGEARRGARIRIRLQGRRCGFARRCERLAAFFLAIDGEHDGAWWPCRRRAPRREPRRRSRLFPTARGSSHTDSWRSTRRRRRAPVSRRRAARDPRTAAGVADRCRSVTTCSSVLRRSFAQPRGRARHEHAVVEAREGRFERRQRGAQFRSVTTVHRTRDDAHARIRRNEQPPDPKAHRADQALRFLDGFLPVIALLHGTATCP